MPSPAEPAGVGTSAPRTKAELAWTRVPPPRRHRGRGGCGRVPPLLISILFNYPLPQEGGGETGNSRNNPLFPLPALVFIVPVLPPRRRWVRTRFVAVGRRRRGLCGARARGCPSARLRSGSHVVEQTAERGRNRRGKNKNITTTTKIKPQTNNEPQN